jgi:hypothetical protein
MRGAREEAGRVSLRIGQNLSEERGKGSRHAAEDKPDLVILRRLGFGSDRSEMASRRIMTTTPGLQIVKVRKASECLILKRYRRQQLRMMDNSGKVSGTGASRSARQCRQRSQRLDESIGQRIRAARNRSNQTLQDVAGPLSKRRVVMDYVRRLSCE